MNKKKYAVIKSVPNCRHIDIDGRVMDFGQKSGGLVVNDPGIAREIEARYEKHGQAVVIPQGVVEQGHHYTFTVPEMPWKRKRENEQHDQQPSGGDDPQRRGAV